MNTTVNLGRIGENRTEFEEVHLEANTRNISPADQLAIDSSEVIHTNAHLDKDIHGPHLAHYKYVFSLIPAVLYNLFRSFDQIKLPWEVNNYFQFILLLRPKKLAIDQTCMMTARRKKKRKNQYLDGKSRCKISKKKTLSTPDSKRRFSRPDHSFHPWGHASRCPS